jgi:hypothetical protein
LKKRLSNGKRKSERLQQLVTFVNQKQWWHVPPRDPGACRKRGKFLASSYREAEFWGRPLMDPIKVSIKRPLVGDEATIERRLFGRQISHEEFGMEQRWKLDAKMKRAALALGYDSILLMAVKEFAEFRSHGKRPRSLELNLFEPVASADFPQ